MSPDFNYSEVPATFLHCLNKQCKHSAKCMRYLVTAYVPGQLPGNQHREIQTILVRTKNPARTSWRIKETFRTRHHPPVG